MSLSYFEREVELPVAAETAFTWHARPGALERLLPPWDDVRIVSRSNPHGEGGLAEGSRVELSMPLGPLRVSWLAEHREVDPPHSFRDVALRSPFAHWDHLHRFDARGVNQSVLVDRIEYRPPGGALGATLGGGRIRRDLERMFRYRHAVTHDDLAMHAGYLERPRLRVAITGSSGMIGTALGHLLTTGGHDVVPLHRGAENRIDAAPAEGADAVVHLAGENIANHRWSEEQKRRIRDSRVQVTEWLCDDLLALGHPPAALISASAIGFYGDRDEERLDEHAARGDSFLADVCLGRESATNAVRQSGMRVVNLRIGMVLSPKGGALKKMLPAFRGFAGGHFGSGEQYMSWISLDDAIGAIHHALMHDELSGPMNLVSPEPVRNAQFSKTLARVLGRPALVPVPRKALRLALGEMADELLLASARVVPGVLTDSGYSFRHPGLEGALRHLLGR